MEMSEHIRIKHVLENLERAMKGDHELLKKGGHNRPYDDHMVNQAELKIMSYTSVPPPGTNCTYAEVNTVLLRVTNGWVESDKNRLGRLGVFIS